MREILFRGKRLDNGEWVYGYIVKHGDRWWIYTGEIEYIYYPMLAENPEKIEVEPGTVFQYTGLKDKNGKKIFEGDVVEYEDESPSNYEYHDNLIMNRGAICYSDGTFYWTNAVATTLEDNVYDGVLDCKVIGNVFDNPELLEVQE